MQVQQEKSKQVVINAGKEVLESNPTSQAQRIAKAFAVLRKKGYFAEMHFQCCQSCGWAAVPDGQDKVVFYHDQDGFAFGEQDGDEHGDNNRGTLVHPLYVAWSGDAEEIIETLSQQGLETEWDGSLDTRIAILPPGGRKAYDEFVRLSVLAEAERISGSQD
jgi:Domain of unknown function (DUF6891)